MFLNSMILIRSFRFIEDHNIHGYSRSAWLNILSLTPQKVIRGHLRSPSVFFSIFFFIKLRWRHKMEVNVLVSLIRIDLHMPWYTRVKSWPWRKVTISNWLFEVVKYMYHSICLDEMIMKALISFLLIHNVRSCTRKTSFLKTVIFCLMTPEISAIDLRSRLMANAAGTGHGLPTAS